MVGNLLGKHMTRGEVQLLLPTQTHEVAEKWGIQCFKEVLVQSRRITFVNNTFLNRYFSKTNTPRDIKTDFFLK